MFKRDWYANDDGDHQDFGSNEEALSAGFKVGQYVGAVLKIAAYFFLVHMIWQNKIEINHIHMTHHGHAPKEATSE